MPVGCATCAIRGGWQLVPLPLGTLPFLYPMLSSRADETLFTELRA